MIKPDNWIERQCQPPTHYTYINDDRGFEGKAFYLSNPETIETLKFKYNRIGWGFVGADEIPELKEKIPTKPMISPFNNRQVTKANNNAGLISHGLSSYGYDARLDSNLKLFTNVNNVLLDPRKHNDKCLVNARIQKDEDGLDYAVLPPNSFMLGHTLEYFCIPRNVLVVCMGKSTLARIGCSVTITPLEPEWEGQIVIEIANMTNLPMKIYPNQGICQLLFFESDEDCQVSYKDKGGKYQGQTGITVAKV